MLAILFLLLCRDGLVSSYRSGAWTSRTARPWSRQWSRHAEQSCEEKVAFTFRQGLSGGDVDLLKRARELDGLGERRRPLYGKSLFVSPRVSDFTSRLEDEHALIFRSAESNGNLNPRDPQFALGIARDSEYNSAVDAVVKGAVSAAVLPVISDRLFPECFSWTGCLGLRLPAKEGGAIFAGMSFVELERLRSLLSPSMPTEPQHTNNLEGVKVACITTRTLTDPQRAVCTCTKKSMEVFAESLKRLGAEVTIITRVLDLDQVRTLGCSILISPATAFAAPEIGSVAGTREDAVDKLPAALSACLAVTLPVGLVAGEDDGYGDDSNELRPREGLPINAVVNSLDEEDCDAALRLARIFDENYSRWSSDVFKIGATRLTASEDMDDAREYSGVYFVSTLLKVLGKRV